MKIEIAFMFNGRRYTVEMLPADVPAFLRGMEENNFDIINLWGVE